MTLRQRILTLLRGECPDRMPWMADLSWWHACHGGERSHYTGKGMTPDLDPRHMGFEGYVQLHRDLGSGLYPWCEDVFETWYEGEEIERTRREEGEMVYEEWRTPLGTLMGIWKKMDCCTAHLKYPVTTPAELKILRFIFERTRHQPQANDYAKLRTKDAAIGELGLVVPTFPSAPLSQMFGDWMGVTGTIYGFYEAPEEMQKTLDCIAEANEEGFQACLKSLAVLFSFNDNISGVNYGHFFELYSMPYYSRKAAEVHAAGKYCYLHTDGSLRGLLPKVAATGVDAAEAVTPQPVGDIAIEDLRDGVGERMILWGGLPGAMFAPPFNWPKVEAHVRRVVAAQKRSGRFVLGVADLVPPNGDITFVSRISELMDEIGWY